MRPGTRACYGGATVGAFSGIMMAATGAILVLITAYQNQRVDETEWMVVAMLCASGFFILIFSLTCCACALCRHASASEEAQQQLENKMFNGRVHPMDTQEAIWTVEGSRPSWESPTSSIPVVEDLNLEDVAEMTAEEAEGEEPEEEKAPEPEPEEEGEKEEEKEEGGDDGEEKKEEET